MATGSNGERGGLFQQLSGRLGAGGSMAGALRYPAYRKFFFGQLASVSGYNVLWLAQSWLVYDLTGSKLALGYVGLATGVPAIVFNLVGGVLADRLDQRRLITFTQGSSALLLAILATLTALDVVELWHILVIAFCHGTLSSLEQPARQSIFPHLLDRKELVTAVALNSAIWQGTRVVAPAIGGLIIAGLGTAFALYLVAGGFLFMAFTMATLHVPPIPRTQGKVMDNMKEGLKFIAGSSVFSFLIAMTFFNSFFGMSYAQLMPVFAEDELGVGATGMGFLLTSSGIGAFLGIFIASGLGSFFQRGSLLISGATLFGGFLAMFALSQWYPVSLLALFLVGMTNSIYMISIQTSLQTMVPDALRGRVMGVYGMTWSIMPLGAMQAGVVASFLGAPFAVAMGGIAVAGFAVGIASTNVRIRNLGAPAPEPAVAAG